MSKIDDKLKQIAGGAPLDNLKSGGGIKRGNGHGGRRPGAGRPEGGRALARRQLKAIVDAQINESVKIQVVDPKTGKKTVVTKPRLLRQLEVLYDIGVQDRSYEAISRWLDRALGRPVQPVEGGDEERPILLKIDF